MTLQQETFSKLTDALEWAQASAHKKVAFISPELEYYCPDYFRDIPTVRVEEIVPARWHEYNSGEPVLTATWRWAWPASMFPDKKKAD